MAIKMKIALVPPCSILLPLLSSLFLLGGWGGSALIIFIAFVRGGGGSIPITFIVCVRGGG